MRCSLSIAKVLSTALFLSLPAISDAQTPIALPYTMTTVAGGLAPRTSYTAGTTVCPGTSSTTASSTAGDNCAAVSGIFGAASRGGVVVDQYGNIFAADDINSAVHMIDASTGTMTVVAGLGAACGSSAGKLDSAGDGCLGSTQTVLSHPRGIGLDAYGNVLIPEYGQNLIHIVCRYASPLCATGTPAPTPSNPIQVSVGYMGLVGGCAAATGSTGSAGTGIDGTPGFSTLNSSTTNTASYPLNLSGSASAFKNSASCSASLGDLNAPRAAWGDVYGNVYYADTNTSRTRVILGPYTSNYFSGVNPLYAALEVNTNWTWTGTVSTSTLKPGFVYTIANVSGNSTTNTTATVLAGSACLTSITANSVTYNNTSVSSRALDTHADGCPFFDSAVTANSGNTDTAVTDAAGNFIFTDPGSDGLLRVLFVQGWANSGAATSAGASGSVASAGVAMYNAILKNNPGITPTPGYMYSLAGGVGLGQTGFTSKTLSTGPTLGNATPITNSNITKIAISPQGNLYIGIFGTSGTVLFYDTYNGTIRQLLTSGSTATSTKGSFCSGSSGAVAKSAYWDGCPASKAFWGNSSGQGLAVDAQGNLYLYDASEYSSGMLVRKVLAQGMGTESTGTLNALTSTFSSAYPLQSLGTTQTQTFWVHFPVATAASAALTNSTNANFSYGTPSCTWYSTVDNSLDCTITATYTPTAAGPQSAQVTLAASGGESITLNLAGTVTGSVLAIDNATSAGTGLLNTAQLFSGNTPYAVATDGAGNVYAAISSGSSYSIVESLAASSGSMVTLASGITAQPTALTVDQTGNVFYLLGGTSTIQELAVSTASGTNTYANATLTYYSASLAAASPVALAVDAAGNIYVADNQSGASTIYRISPSALVNLTAASCDYSASVSVLPSLCQTTISSVGAFGVVSSMAVSPSGTIYVADTTNGAVYKLTPGVSSGIYTYTKSIVASATVDGLATDAAGDLYALGSSGVTMYPASGSASVAIYGASSSPRAVAVDGTGNAYIADSGFTYVTQVQRGAVTENFGSSYSTEFTATLTNAGNLGSAAQSISSGAEANDFNLGGGSSSGCTFVSGNLLAAMTAGQACTATAFFPAIGSGSETDNIVFGVTAPASSVAGDLTLTGVADQVGFDTTVAIGTASTSSPVYSATGTEVSYPITVTANPTATDGVTPDPSGPITSNYVYVTVDSLAPVQYYFTSTSGLQASFTLNLTGLAATTTTKHSFTVSFPQQGSFLASSGSQSAIAIAQQPTVLNWSPSTTSQQVSASIGTGVLDAALTASVAGNTAYAYGAAPSCTTTSAASGSTPIDASTYLPVGSYTLYATFCPTDSTDYTTATASTSYAVMQASTVAAVGASTMVVAPSGGNYTSLSAALVALPATGGTIYIAPGMYTGQNVVSYPNVALRGLGGDPTQVVITGENGAFSTSTFTTGTLPSGFSFGPAGKGGDEGSATLDVSKNTFMGQTALSSTYTPNNFYAENLTIQNTYNTDPYTTSTEAASGNGGTCSAGGPATSLQNLYNNNAECGSQALALWITADQAVLNDVNLVSQQDTLYAATQGCGTYCTSIRQYMWRGLIVGDVDYTFGDAALVFDHTNFFTTWHGITSAGSGTETITAQNKRFATGTTPATISSYPTSSDYLSGFICNGCTLLSQSTGMTKLYYGRPYNIQSSGSSYSTWLSLNSNVDQVAPAGWIGWDGASEYLPTSTYGEFNTKQYTDPTPGTLPYPYALFNNSNTSTVPSVLYVFDAAALVPSFAYYSGSATTGFNLSGGNTGSGVSPLSAREIYSTALNAGTAVPYYPLNFLSTTVPATKMSLGELSNWNPLTTIASQVNAFVPPTIISPIAYGSSVTILGRPQTPGAGVVPTGTYSFYDSLGTNQACTAPSSSCTLLTTGTLDASGATYLTTSTLAAGTHYITMVYSGDANFTASTSATYPITVLASGVPTTTTTLNVADTSATYGKPITGTVSVSPTAATGTVTIYLDSAPATTCTLSGGSCSWSLNSVAIGSHALSASYSGSSGYGASNSISVAVNVAAATATGDTRTVTEPSFPSVCTHLTAALITDPSIQDLDASVDATNSNIDGARIQAALNSCSGTGNAVELSMDNTGTYNAFLSGPLTMPSNVTLLVDPGVTLYFSRNVQDYDTTSGTHTCGTINNNSATGSCLPLIGIPKTSTNVGIMGYGKLNGRGGDTLLNAFTTSGFAMPSPATWWSISAQSNGEGSQQNPRFIQINGGASNVTLYKITVLNSPLFHISTTGGVTSLTIWDVKVSSPTYTRNTDGIDPGDVTNGTIAYSWVSDGDDNVAASAPNAPEANVSVINNHFYAGHGESIGSSTNGGVSNILFDGNMLAGDSISGTGSAINATPANIAGTNYGVNYADGNSTGIRIKTANDRGGLVTNIQYSNSCFLNHKSDIQFTPYYSSGDSTNEFPNYTNILLQNLTFLNTASSSGSVEMDGEYNTNNGSPVVNPLMIALDNVTFPSALSSLINSTAPAESSATSSAWGTNFSGGTGQYVNLTVGPGQVSSNFLTTYINLAAVPANNDTLTNNISQPALDPPNCVFTYIAPELTGPTGVAQTVPYGNSASLDVILTPIVAGSAYPTGTFTVTDTTTGNSFTGTLSATTDTQVATIPASDLTIGIHTFTATYLGDSNYTIPASYQTFGSYNVTVIPAPQTITFGTIPTQAPGTSLTLTASASSGLPVSFTSTTTSVCVVTNNTASFLQAGICSITASQAGNSNYNGATQVTQSLSVVLAPTITLTTTATLSKVTGGYQATVTITNTGSVTASNV
ncbi:MAG: pectinesterase family protein, partial [Terracidiphilus sp.]